MVEGEGPSGVKLGEAPDPTCEANEIRVEVKASAINRADLIQTLGLYPAPPGAPATIPGLEYAGQVIERGSRVRRWNVGDRVMGLVGGGAWAEQLVVHEDEAIELPSGLSYSQAAAVPEAFITAWDALVLQGHLKPGHTVLIHAVASGVGTAALQVSLLAGARVIGTGRNATKLERAKALGSLHTIVVPEDASFASAVKTHAPNGANVVLDLVGGAFFSETIEATAICGTILLVGLVGGATAEVPLRTVLGKRLTIIGTTLRSRRLEEKITLARRFEETMTPHFVSGRLRPVIESEVPFSEAARALDRLAANDTFGKTVLTW